MEQTLTPRQRTSNVLGFAPARRVMHVAASASADAPTILSATKVTIEAPFRVEWNQQADTIRMPLVHATWPVDPPDPADTVVMRDQDGQPLVWQDQRKMLVSRIDLDATATAILLERYLPSKRPWIARLPIHPHSIPAAVRWWVHRRQSKRDISHEVREIAAGQLRWPQWPIDPSFETFRGALRAATMGHDAQASIWPKNKRFAVCLSHDIDTFAAYTWIRPIAAIEKAKGLRSSWHILATGAKVDHATVQMVLKEGHEVALHGDTHDNRLGYETPARIHQRLQACQPLRAAYPIVGFRAPSLLGTEALDAALAAHQYTWSSSAPDVDVGSVRGPSRGVGSVFPYFRAGGLVEVPVTVPLDDRLLARGLQGQAWLDAMCHKINWIESVGGVAMIGTHPEPHLSGNPQMLQWYALLLRWLIQKPNAWFATGRQVAAHWHALHLSDVGGGA